jgi:hypothetical protein
MLAARRIGKSSKREKVTPRVSIFLFTVHTGTRKGLFRQRWLLTTKSQASVELRLLSRC